MDKKKHETVILQLRNSLETDIRELYFKTYKRLKESGEAQDDDYGFELNDPLVLEYQDDDIVGMCEQDTEDGITAKVCAVTDDGEGEETIVNLDQLSIEDLNNLYIDLCDR